MDRIFLGISLSLLGLVGCGVEENSALKNTEVSPQIWEGTDSEGAPCRLAVSRDSEGHLSRVTLDGTFVADYKVPMPFSGLYGKYRWPGGFDSVKHGGNVLELKRSLLGDADVVKTEGEPLFWNTGKHHHKLVVKPSLTAPQIVSYDAKEKLGGVFTTVDITLSCRFP